jgi:hypothetical protein
MTPGELNDYARQQYNATSDDFFSDDELYRHAWHAQNILAKEAGAIENTYTTPTVDGQQEYSYPTNTLAIKRITYNGQRLTKIDFKEDDVLTGQDAATTAKGSPVFYMLFDRVIYLRPIPDAVYTLKLFTFDQPQEVSATSSLDVPPEFHLDMANYLLWRMATKDQNFQAAEYHKVEWEQAVLRCKRWSKKRLIADGFKTVKDENTLTQWWGFP